MRRGFTLIEILIVIAIAAALLAVGVLSLNGLRSGSTIDSEAQQLVAVLHSAQEKSIGQDTGGTGVSSRWGVYFDTSSARNSYSLFRVDETLKSLPEQTRIPGDVIDTHTLAAPLTLTLNGPGVTSSIIFAKADGRPTATTSIQIANEGNQETAKSVTVTAQGRIDYQ